MNQRGTAYILALFCLLAVSAVTLLWQKQLQSYPDAVLRAWSTVLADQAALSGIEYARALTSAGKVPHGTRTIAVPGGSCRLTVTREGDALVVRSEASVRAGRGIHTAGIVRRFR